MREHFSAAEDLVLLVKPGLMGSSDTDFCLSAVSAFDPRRRHHL